MTTLKRRCSGLFHSAALGLAVLIGALWASGAVQAQADPAAGVHFASGYVAATAPGVAERQLAKGDDVYRGDRVDTADNGRVQMRFTDGGLVSLMPNSTFTVEEYFHDGGPEEDASLVFGLLKGGLRTVTGTIGSVQHDQYELKTPVATLGIRGTEYVAVLRPANTLRVHVGRGKVVITNDQGSLEVPEGRNAIVTLGSAPEFSEQGPQYQATGPMGDRLSATYQHRQDPHLLDPRANMPETIPDLSEAPEDIIAALPPGSYQVAGILPPGLVSLTDFYFSGIDFEFDGTGHPSSLPPGTTSFDTGNWTSFDIQTAGVMSWGVYTDGDGTVYPESLTLTNEQYLPYVVGSAPTNMPTTGTLNYSMTSPSTTAFMTGSSGTTLGTLTKFDLEVRLDNSEFLLDMGVTIGSQVYSTTPTAVNVGSIPTPGFSFAANVTGGGCSTGCSMGVNGFFAGDGANQAGVTYQFDDGPNTIYGATGLATSASGLGM